MTSLGRGGRRQIWLGLLFSVAGLAIVALVVRPGDLLAALRATRVSYLGITLAGILAFLLLRSLRWRFLLENDASVVVVFHIQSIGYLLNTVLPLRIGDVARAILIGNVPPITISRGLSTLAIERLLDMLFIVALLPLALIQVQQLPPWMLQGARASGLLALLAMVVLIVAANQQALALRLAARVLSLVPRLDAAAWLERIRSFLRGLDRLRRLRDGLILIALTIATWLPIIFSYYGTMRAVNLPASLAQAAFVVCAGAFSVALPSSPGQIGVFHAGVIAALQVIGQPAAESAAFAVVYHAMNSATMILAGIVGVLATGATFRQILAQTQAYVSGEDKQ